MLSSCHQHLEDDQTRLKKKWRSSFLWRRSRSGLLLAGLASSELRPLHGVLSHADVFFPRFLEAHLCRYARRRSIKTTVWIVKPHVRKALLPSHISTPLFPKGAFPVLSLMVGAVVTRLVPLDEAQANATNIPGMENLTPEQKRVIVASSMTFLVGIFQVRLESDKTAGHFVTSKKKTKKPKLVISFLAARHGHPAVWIHRRLPVEHARVRLHHGRRRSHSGVPAQICVRAGSARNQRPTLPFLRKFALSAEA